MKKIYLLINFLIVAQLQSIAGIGTSIKTFVDASRSNRNVPCDIYYPAVTSGANTVFSSGTYGLVVIGHGFGMGTDAYKTYGDSLANKGYVVAIVNTETAIIPFPSHLEFGKDLAFIVDKIKAENTVSTSLFFNHMNGKAALIGHSMGGGATFLSAQFSNNINAMVTLSAAETNPSAVAACANITVPNFVIAGNQDCVAGIATNQQLMYNALKSDCKYLMNITGATHCGMADQNNICTAGEACIVGQPYISRPKQYSLIFQPLYMYLDFYLNSNTTAMGNFQTYINTADSFVAQKTCLPLSISQNNFVKSAVYPNPVQDYFMLPSQFGNYKYLNIIDLQGKTISSTKNIGSKINTNNLQTGLYFILVELQNGSKEFLKIQVLK